MRLAGTYQVSALTAANGCAATGLGGSVNVIVNPFPTATISGGGPVCSGSPLPVLLSILPEQHHLLSPTQME